jgi:regulation of enolase protein 1 (concanavalin A-like superfamily)
MRRLAVGLALVAAFACTGSDARAQARPNPSLAGWGEAINPARDCRIALAAGSLLIEVPGTLHGSFSDVGPQAAPRVMRSCDGDFVAQVKLSGNVSHAGQRTSPQGLAYHGAGLVLWRDPQAYIRFERAAIVRQGGEVTHYANYELHRDGRVAVSKALRIPDEDTYLRLERRDDRIFALVSNDGCHWSCLDPISEKFPREVKLGFAAVNTSTDPLKVAFSNLEIFKREAQPANP